MRKVLPVLLALVAISAVSLIVASEGLLQIWHFDVGQADSTLLISPSGVVVLFDCGETHYRSSGNAEYVADQIEDLTGARHVDYFVLSHLHTDHAGYVGEGGLWSLVEEQGVAIGTLLTGDLFTYRTDISEKSFASWCDFITTSQAADFNWEIAAVQSEIRLGNGITLTVCSLDGNELVSPESRCSANDISLGVRISYGNFQEWIGGDLSGVSTGKYIDVETCTAPCVGDIEVLRVNHHGAAYSTNEAFLRTLDPEVSIISVGEHATYGHPDLDILTRLAATSDVYLTTLGNSDGAIASGTFCLEDFRNVLPDAGDILIETDGRTYWVNGKQYTALP